MQVANLTDRRTGMYPLEEKHLRPIERAETREVSLVQQCFTDRAIGMSGDPPHSLLRVPVTSKQVGPEMPDDGVLGRGRKELDDREPISHCIMIMDPEHCSDFKGRSAIPAPAMRVNPPGAVHPEVSVQSERIAEPEQLMLAARDHFPYRHAGQIGRCQGRHSKFGSGQLATSEHLIEPLACPPDGVSLRHGLIVPSSPESPDRAQAQTAARPLAMLTGGDTVHMRSLIMRRKTLYYPDSVNHYPIDAKPSCRAIQKGFIHRGIYP